MASTVTNGIDCYQERHRPLQMASLVYEREICSGEGGLNGPRPDLRGVDAADKDYYQQATVLKKKKWKLTAPKMLVRDPPPPPPGGGRGVREERYSSIGEVRMIFYGLKFSTLRFKFSAK